LLSQRVKVNVVNILGTPLYYAARNGNTDLLTKLFAQDADPNLIPDPFSKTPLWVSLNNDRKEAAEMIKAKEGLEKLPPPAFLPKDEQAIREYLKDNVNRVDEKGRSLAHYWAYYGGDVLGKVLKELKADFNLPDKEGRTPIHYAVIEGN